MSKEHQKVKIESKQTKTLAFEGALIKSAEEGNEVYTMSFSSNEPYLRWFGYEITNPSKMDFSRLNQKSPILFNHNRDEYIGVIDKAYLKDGKAYVDFRFSTSEQAQQVKKDVDGGFLANASFGYSTLEMEEIGEKDGIPVFDCTTYPFEVSITTVPADISVGFKGFDSNEVKEIKDFVEINIIKKELEKEIENKDLTKEKEQEEIEKEKKLEKNKEMQDNKNNININEREMNIYQECLKIAKEKSLQDVFFKYFETEGEKTIEGFKDFIIEAKTSAPAKTEKETAPVQSTKSVMNIGNALIAQFKKDEAGMNSVRIEEDKLMARTGFRKSDPNSIIVDADSFLSKDITVANPASAGLLAQPKVDNSFLVNMGDDLALSRLGVKFFRANGNGSIFLPVDHRGTDLSDAYKAEKAKGKNFELNLSSVEVKPYFIQGIAQITKEMMARSGTDLNAYAVQAIRNALLRAIEVNVLGLGTQPGVFNNTSIPRVPIAKLDFASLVALRGVPRAKRGIINNSSTAFLTDYIVSDIVETSPKNAVEFLYNPNTSGDPRVVGQKFVTTDMLDTVEAGGDVVTAYDPIVFADWSQLYVAIWDTIEVTMTYNFYENGDARLLASVQIGAAVVRPESFVIGEVASAV